MTTPGRRLRCRLAMRGAGLLLLLPGAVAQAGEAEVTPAADTGDRVVITEFETVRVVEKRPEWIDPFAFRPLFDPHDNMFQRDWNEPPSVEEVAMRGGYVQMGIDYALRETAEAVMRLPGWQNQIQPAQARPPPLDAAQAERAARLRESEAP